MNRADRRRNPDQWWQIVARAHGAEVALPVNEDNVYLKGDVQGATIVQLPAGFEQASSSEKQAFIEGLQCALSGAGIKNAVIVPKGIEFLCLRPVTTEKGKELERNVFVAQQRAERRLESKH